MAIRVPTPDVSLVDLVAELERDVTEDEVNAAFKEAADGAMSGVLSVSDEPLVSVDYTGNPYSSIVDGLATSVMDGRMVKVLSWYDNEWGYSSRVNDLVEYVGERPAGRRRGAEPTSSSAGPEGLERARLRPRPLAFWDQVVD